MTDPDVTSTAGLDRLEHDHTFGLDKPMPGESRTKVVIGITGAMMVVEIATGVLFGSMALLADGLHMASHTVALALAYFAYVYARRHARDERFSFGTGKVNSLAGFTGAILLAVFALMMAAESLDRFMHPVTIKFDQAILVAVVGLVVNAVCALVLGHTHEGEDGHGDGHEHAHDHGTGHQHDHNLRSAYLHVLADAMTSVLAIMALLSGKYLGLNWMDPIMGIVGAILVANWSLGLIRVTGAVLMDKQGPSSARDAIRAAIEAGGHGRVTDLHLWTIGPNRFAAIVCVASDGAVPAARFKALVPRGLGIVHLTVEVNSECRMANGE